MWVELSYGRESFKKDFIEKVDRVIKNYRMGDYIDFGIGLEYKHQDYLESKDFAVEIIEGKMFAIRYSKEQIKDFFDSGRIKCPGTKVWSDYKPDVYGYIDAVYNGYYVVFTNEGPKNFRWHEVSLLNCNYSQP